MNNKRSKDEENSNDRIEEEMKKRLKDENGKIREGGKDGKKEDWNKGWKLKKVRMNRV